MQHLMSGKSALRESHRFNQNINVFFLYKPSCKNYIINFALKPCRSLASFRFNFRNPFKIDPVRDNCNLLFRNPKDFKPLLRPVRNRNIFVLRFLKPVFRLIFRKNPALSHVFVPVIIPDFVPGKH